MIKENTKQDDMDGFLLIENSTSLSPTTLLRPFSGDSLLRPVVECMVRLESRQYVQCSVPVCIQELYTVYIGAGNWGK
jgi:hypothetical protein